MLRAFSILFMTFFVISSCATNTQPRVTYEYLNPNVPSENKEIQWLIDRGYCLQELYKTPLPIRMPCRSDFAKAYCEGRQDELMAEESEVRQQIFDGCIAKKGYRKEEKKVNQ